MVILLFISYWNPTNYLHSEFFELKLKEDLISI